MFYFLLILFFHFFIIYYHYYYYYCRVSGSVICVTADQEGDSVRNFDISQFQILFLNYSHFFFFFLLHRDDLFFTSKANEIDVRKWRDR